MARLAETGARCKRKEKRGVCKRNEGCVYAFLVPSQDTHMSAAEWVKTHADKSVSKEDRKGLVATLEAVKVGFGCSATFLFLFSLSHACAQPSPSSSCSWFLPRCLFHYQDEVKLLPNGRILFPLTKHEALCRLADVKGYISGKSYAAAKKKLGKGTDASAGAAAGAGAGANASAAAAGKAEKKATAKGAKKEDAASAAAAERKKRKWNVAADGDADAEEAVKKSRTAENSSLKNKNEDAESGDEKNGGDDEDEASDADAEAGEFAEGEFKVKLSSSDGLKEAEAEEQRREAFRQRKEQRFLLFVGNLSFDMTAADVRKIFAKVPVKEVRMLFKKGRNVRARASCNQAKILLRARTHLVVCLLLHDFA